MILLSSNFDTIKKALKFQVLYKTMQSSHYRIYLIFSHTLKRGSDLLKAFAAYLCVNLCSFAAAVAQQFLNAAQIRSLFQHLGRIALP
jgi:hypothetical protein